MALDPQAQPIFYLQSLMNLKDSLDTDFDPGDEVEREKLLRQEIRKVLVAKMSDALKSLGFKKVAASEWTRERDQRIERVGLQRSSDGHKYFINLDTGKGGLSNRFEFVINELEGGGQQGDRYVFGEKGLAAIAVLNFDDAAKPSHYKESPLLFGRSLSREEILQKIQDLHQMLMGYIPLWSERAL